MPSLPRSYHVHPTVHRALIRRQPVVALESAVVTHGLPVEVRESVAEALAQAIRGAGAVPAMVAVLNGRIRVGLTREDFNQLLSAENPRKCTRADLGWLLTQRATAGTTVSATIHVAARAGIEFAATGGIGGVHRDAGETLDISADLIELTRTRIVLVASGPKIITDLRKTYEYLETLSVPVLGYQTRELPGFYVRSTGIPLRSDAENPGQLVAAIRHYRALGYAGGILVVNPVPTEQALDGVRVERWLTQALRQAAAQSVQGPALTPFLLDALHRLSRGATLRANQALLVANARLAAELAAACTAC